MAGNVQWKLAFALILGASLMACSPSMETDPCPWHEDYMMEMARKGELDTRLVEIWRIQGDYQPHLLDPGGFRANWYIVPASTPDGIHVCQNKTWVIYAYQK